MVKTLARSIREYKKAAILTPLLVTVEVILECIIPFIIANLVNQMQAGCGMDVIAVSYTHLDVYKRQDPNNMNLCQSLPVHDFGDGRLTLTDGHSRAFIAYQHKTKVPIVYDTDDIVTCDEGQLLYKNDIVWCRRFHLRTIADLENRIVDDSEYQSLWIDRCKQASNLLTQTDDCLLYNSRCV